VSKLYEYEIIYHYLIELINNSSNENIKLPSENVLSEKFNCTRATVRQAITKLKNEGLVYSKKGSGIFTSPSKIRYELSPYTSFTSEIEKLNKIPSSNILDSQIINADESLAQEFDIDVNSKLLKVTIVRSVDNIPFLLTISYLNIDKLDDIENKIKNTQSLTVLLKNEYKIEPIRNHSEIDIVPANAYISEKLSMQSSMPLIKISSTSLNKKNNDVLEYCESYFRSDMAKIIVNYTGDKQ